MRPWSAIAAATGHQYERLLQGLNASAKYQRRQLAQILHINSATGFGRQYNFDRLHCPDRFRQKVPLHGYDDLCSDLGRQLRGESRLLSEPVLHAEETGGSSAGPKLIPYSRSSLQAFRAAVYPWLHDLAQRYPRLGCSYFAISPAAGLARVTDSGIPIGAATDAVYFGSDLQQPIAAISLAPEQLGTVEDMKLWRRLTLAYLLRAHDLSLVSVWSPGFITALLAELSGSTEQPLRDLYDGIPALLPGLPPLPPVPARARLVAAALSGKKPDTRKLWPQLQLISCWTHASSAQFIPQLRDLFPQADIQGKGLLSTEGVVSVPLTGYEYPVHSVNSGFHEFLDPAGCSLLAHELTRGQTYEVVMTVPGLYRYRSGDQVRVRGWAGTAPQLEFIGRRGLVCDLVGEKLGDAFVVDCLRQIDGFAMIAPVLKPVPHYCLYVEQANTTLQEKVEMALQGNPQYAYARALGQLDPLRVVPVERPLQRYQQWALQRGQRLGDIKPPSLSSDPGWDLRMFD